MRILKNISNTGNLKFIQDVGFPTKLQPNAIVIEDFNNNQKQDIIISNEAGSLSIYNNESTIGNIEFKIDSICFNIADRVSAESKLSKPI